MRSRLFSIPGSDPDRQVRGQLLKGTAALLAVMCALDLPLIIGGDPFDGLLLGLVVAVLVISLATFVLAHNGFIRTGAVILSLSVFVAISLSVDADKLLNTPLGSSYLIPILVVGLVIGSHAVIAFSACLLYTSPSPRD